MFIHVFFCLSSEFSKELRLKVCRKDEDEISSRCQSCYLFPSPFTSLMKGTPCQMIKHRYDPSYPVRRCRQKFKSSSKMLPIYSHIHKTRLGRMAMSVLATVFNMLASRIQRPLLGIFNGFILSL